MKTEYDKSNLIIHVGQILFYIAFMLIPSLVFRFENQDFGYFWPVFEKTLQIFWMLGVLYFLNFYLLVPRLLFAGEKIWFAGINILLILFEKFRIFWLGNIAQGQDWASYYWIGEAIGLLLEIILIFIAISVRYLIRWNDMQRRLQEERRKAAEAELTWLKNQLNPHFLFNTLNNIYALIAINQDKAQDAVHRLSKMLRYMLYADKKEVALEEELQFLRNFIELMKLRLNSSNRLTVHFPENGTEGLTIAPLLLITLVENAFKHGISGSKPSEIKINVTINGNIITLYVENSLFPKSDDKTSSGIGITNMQRRLALLYPGSYNFRRDNTGNKYTAILSIDLCKPKI